ncbi:hypothetical protein ACJGFN_000102 [Escherichia coli]
MRKQLQALGRLKTGQMNKTESAYCQHLELRKHAGEVAWYRFEGIKLRLAPLVVPITLPREMLTRHLQQILKRRSRRQRCRVFLTQPQNYPHLQRQHL